MKNKKSRMKAVILLIVSVISLVNCFSKSTKAYVKDSKQSIYNNIIPKPVSYREEKGQFQINKNTKIYIKGNNGDEDNELGKIADYINEKIGVPTGFKWIELYFMM